MLEGFNIFKNKKKKYQVGDVYQTLYADGTKKTFIITMKSFEYNQYEYHIFRIEGAVSDWISEDILKDSYEINLIDFVAENMEYYDLIDGFLTSAVEKHWNVKFKNMLDELEKDERILKYKRKNKFL
jgi:hypothetical protein